MCQQDQMVASLNQCGLFKVTGQIDQHIDLTARGIIKPLLTPPKYRVNSVIKDKAIVITPVLLATKTEHHQTQYKDLHTNQIVKNKEIKYTKPIYGEIR